MSVADTNLTISCDSVIATIKNEHRMLGSAMHTLQDVLAGSLEADHATLRARGSDVDAEIARKGKRRLGLVSSEVTVGDSVPPQFFFRDTDGNRFLIVETD